jgi:hypothetical protein
VRVRRSPKIGVFLGIGAVIGALVAIIAGNSQSADPSIPTSQAIGYLLLILAPLGAIVGGAIALVLDRISERRARTVEAERILPPRPVEEPIVPEEAEQPVTETVADPDPTDRA